VLLTATTDFVARLDSTAKEQEEERERAKKAAEAAKPLLDDQGRPIKVKKEPKPEPEAASSASTSVAAMDTADDGTEIFISQLYILRRR